MSRLLLGCVLALVASVALAQDKKDDKKPEPKGESVEGKVTLNGAPLQAGTIKFLSKNGKQTIAGKIIDGTYEARVPKGEYRVTINGPEPKKGDPPPVQLPAKYSDPKLSTLTVTITAGKQSINFDLKIK
jgi:hypothetical protein